MGQNQPQINLCFLFYRRGGARAGKRDLRVFEEKLSDAGPAVEVTRIITAANSGA